MSSHGFKEWSRVCQLLDAGRQSIILRKGGIAEGRDGFAFRHRAFFLFPTRFHQQDRQLRPDWIAELPDPERIENDADRPEVTVALRAEIAETRVLRDWPAVRALAAFHAWSEDTVRARFDYDDAPGISVAVLRVFRLAHPWTFPNAPRFGGCRSWLQLPDCPDALIANGTPVLDDAAFEALRNAIPLPPE